MSTTVESRVIRRKKFFNPALFPLPSDPILTHIANKAATHLKAAEDALEAYNQCVRTFRQYEYNQFDFMRELSSGCSNMQSDWVFTLLQDGPTPNPYKDYFHENPNEPLRTGKSQRLLSESVQQVREKLGCASGWICRYCNQSGSANLGPDGRQWHVDHLYPVSRGGDSNIDNLALACATCNLQKSAKLLSDAIAGKESRNVA